MMSFVNSSVSVIGGADGPTAIFVAGEIGNPVIPWIVGTGIVLIMIVIVMFLKKRK